MTSSGVPPGASGGFSKESSRHLLRQPRLKYEFIAEHAHEFAVTVRCHALEVWVSGYYAWRHRPLCQRAQTDAVVRTQIQQLFQQGRHVYGSPRIHAAQQQAGVRCARKRVARLMQAAGLTARRRPRKPRTTDSQHTHPVAPNRLARHFRAAGNQKWVADITAIPTRAGWLYLAAILAVYSRLVVGWAMDQYRDETLVQRALAMALARRQPIREELLHHSDRGSQYTSAAYRAHLARHGITVSMSRKGDCSDNALLERFLGALKAECVDRHDFQTHAEAHTPIFDYWEVFYNRQRLHSALG